MKNSDKKLPKYLLLENVKALINKNHLEQFNKWINKLNKLGYESKYYLLNSVNFGSLQNRERVFCLSVLKEHKNKVNFKFPNLEKINNKTNRKLKDILNDSFEYEKKYIKYKNSNFKLTKNNIMKASLINYTSYNSESYIYDINYYGPTLTASGAMSRLKLFFDENKIREMKPIECFQYMGFNKNDFNKISIHNLISDNKLIYLCGNSISVEVLEEIFRSLRF